MMKVEVLKEFKDIHTGEHYAIGAIIEVSEERAEEIAKNLPGFTVEVAEVEAPEIEEVEADATETKPRRKSTKK